MFKNYAHLYPPLGGPFLGPELRNLYSGDWEVLRSFYYKQYKVEKGFISDLFSVPRLARWAYPKSMKRGNVAAILHDSLLTNARELGLTREQVDDIFLDAMRDAGVRRGRMSVIYTGVTGYTKWLRLTGKLD